MFNGYNDLHYSLLYCRQIQKSGCTILLDELKKIPDFSISVNLDRVVLFESVLTIKSPIIKEIISFNFKYIDELCSMDIMICIIPYCTAGRFRKPDAQEGKILLNKLKKIPEFSIPVKLDRVVLFESVLTNKSPIYKEIISFDLK